MKSKILIIAILGALIGGYFAYAMYNKPHRNISKETATYTLTANQIFDDFENDEEFANRKYLDKVIAVSGDIIDVTKDQTNHTVITLEAENAMAGGVLCTLKDENVNIEDGKPISLKCKCNGFLMDVVLTDCTVIKK